MRSCHGSSGAVYQTNGGQTFTEDSPHGNHHAHMMPTYSIWKIVCRVGGPVQQPQRMSAAHALSLRLNVPYGRGGSRMAVHCNF